MVGEANWRDIEADPNGRAALAERQRQLDAAWCPSPTDRSSFIADVCNGRRVLDLGCAGQATKIDDPRWLHRRILEVAESCVGADYERDEVDRLRSAGFDVVFADVSAGPGELAERAPFDVVVAGELIEHLPSPQSLLDFAAQVLRPGGQLVVTTPNPFALLRVASARTLRNFDNVDHVVLVAPTGIVEMANRAGFRVRSAATTDLPLRRAALVHALKAELWHVRHPRRDRPWWVIPLADVISAWGAWNRGQLGETSIYVLELR